MSDARLLTLVLRCFIVCSANKGAPSAQAGAPRNLLLRPFASPVKPQTPGSGHNLQRFKADLAAFRVLDAEMEQSQLISRVSAPLCRSPFPVGSRFLEALARSDTPKGERPEVLVLQGGWKSWCRNYGSDTGLCEAE